MTTQSSFSNESFTFVGNCNGFGIIGNWTSCRQFIRGGPSLFNTCMITDLDGLSRITCNSKHV